MGGDRGFSKAKHRSRDLRSWRWHVQRWTLKDALLLGGFAGCCVLAGCGGGGSSAPSALPNAPAPSPSADLGGLLSDAQLVPLPDPALPSPLPQYAAWIGPNSFPIRSLDNTQNYNDLHFLDSALKGVQIVALGESGHGVREFSALKVRLIKYLHEHLGFNVLVFESNMLSAYNAGSSMNYETPTQALESGIFPVWWTPDLLDLFTYIQVHYRDTNALQLNGMDVQYYTTREITLRGYVFQELLAPLDLKFANTVQATDVQYSTLLKKAIERDPAAQATLVKEKSQIESFYTNLAAYFDAHAAQITAGNPAPGIEAVMRQVAASTVYDVEAVIDAPLDRQNGTLTSLQARDQGMAANLIYLPQHVYPGQKIIVWAHNGHIAEDNEYFGFPDTGATVRSMYGPAYYAIGLFMHRGQARFNSGTIYTLVEPPGNSLEDIMYTSNRIYDFVDMEHQTQVPGNAWMFSSQTQFDDFAVNYGPGTPALMWNGAIYVDTVTPPTYLQSGLRRPASQTMLRKRRP